MALNLLTLSEDHTCGSKPTDTLKMTRLVAISLLALSESQPRGSLKELTILADIRKKDEN